MKFALKVVGLPVLLFLVSALMNYANPHSSAALAIGAVSLFGMWLSVPVMVVYIVARIWKRATRDSDPYQQHR